MEQKKKLYRTISIVSLLVMLNALIVLFGIFYHIHSSGEQYQELSRQARGTSREQLPAVITEQKRPDQNTSEPEERTEPESEEQIPEPVYAQIPVDFSYLEEMGFSLVREKRYKTNQHVFIRKG